MEIDWDVDYATLLQKAQTVVVTKEVEEQRKENEAWWDRWRAQHHAELDVEARKEGFASLSEKRAWQKRRDELQDRLVQQMREKRGPSWQLISSNDPQQAKFAQCRYALNLREPECSAGCKGE